MADKAEIRKLTEYRCQINNKVVESIQESVTRLNEAMAMIADLQNINEAFGAALAEADQENKSQTKDIDILKQKIESMKEAVRLTEEKEKQYAKMDLSMAKVSALLASLEEREKKLSIEEDELVRDRQSFEAEKSSVVSARREAEEKAERHLKDKNEAIRSRDAAIAEREKALEEKKKAEEQKAEAEKGVAELREELAEYSNASAQNEKTLNKTIELMEWYRNYAIAVDCKIIDWFRHKNRDLEGHYRTFLNNPDKLEEIHTHFPDFVMDDNPSGDFYDSNEDSYKVGEDGTSEKSKSAEGHQEAGSNNDAASDDDKVVEDMFPSGQIGQRFLMSDAFEPGDMAGSYNRQDKMKKEKKDKKDKRDKKSDRPEFLD